MAEETATPSPYEAAVWVYRHAGWQGTLPLPLRKKSPPPDGWTGTTAPMPSDYDVLEWIDNGALIGRKSFPVGNIALRLPKDVLGIDVDHYGDKPGGYILDDLERAHGPLPPTWRVTSRDDGRSGIRFYRVPEGLRWPGVLGPGIETIRHGHRYAVVWPSLHPDTGTAYRWITPDGLTAVSVPQIDELPALPEAWVTAITGNLVADEQARLEMAPAAMRAFLEERSAGFPCLHMMAAIGEGVDAIVAAAAAGSARHEAAMKATNRVTWLAGEGHPGAETAIGALQQAFLTAVANARPPGVAAAEFSRMVYGGVEIAAAAHPQPQIDPCISAGGLNKEQTWPTHPGRYPSDSRSTGNATPASSTSSNGSRSPSSGSPTTSTATTPHPVPAASAEVPLGSAVPSTSSAPGAETPDTASEVERTSWWPRDLTPALTGERVDPPPLYLRRLDEENAAFYAGRVNGIIGPSESGKTWVALVAVLDAIRRGESVTYLDFEDTMGGIVGRLRALGATPEEIAVGFAYIAPEQPFHEMIQTGFDLAEHFDIWQPTLVIVDGYNAALGIQGGDLNSNKDVNEFSRHVLKYLARGNRCVVYIDHVSKNHGDNPIVGGIGAQAKRADTTGTTIRVETILAFGKGQKGKLRLWVDKDRQGDVRGISAPGKTGHWFADANIESAPDGEIRITVTAPEGFDPATRTAAPFRPTGYMQRVSAWLVDNPDSSGKKIIDGVGGKAETVRAAIAALIAEGYVSATRSGRATLHTLVREYLETSDLVPEDPGLGNGSRPVPNGSPEPVVSMVPMVPTTPLQGWEPGEPLTTPKPESNDPTGSLWEVATTDDGRPIYKHKITGQVMPRD